MGAAIELELGRAVEWRDLVPMRRRDGIVECLHPAPWLAGSWLLAGQALWLPAAAASFMFFLTALRLNHEAIHHNLGFRPRGHRLVLHILSLMMLGSNSAVAFNHLRHHRHVGRPEDVEGKCGRMSLRRVLAYGPTFPFEMHRNAWRRGGPGLRRQMLVDGALNLAFATAILGSGLTALLYHLIAMVCAQCLTAFFAVWTTHHGCDGEPLVARTQRSRLINFCTYNMFLHMEHHLFPGVPVRRLGRLAARLDAAAPEVAIAARHVL